MTLSELLAASLLLSGCVAASSQLKVSVLAAGMAEEQRQELRERVEAELNGIESLLAQQAAGSAAEPEPSCAAWLTRWREELQLLAAEGGLQRRQEVLQEEALLQVEVDAAGLEEPRRRMYSPAAYGLCGAPELG